MQYQLICFTMKCPNLCIYTPTYCYLCSCHSTMTKQRTSSKICSSSNNLWLWSSSMMLLSNMSAYLQVCENCWQCWTICRLTYVVNNLNSCTFIGTSSKLDIDWSKLFLPSIINNLLTFARIIYKQLNVSIAHFSRLSKDFPDFFRYYWRCGKCFFYVERTIPNIMLLFFYA